MINWSFPLNNNGTNTGFNDGAIDTFAGNRLSSVVREVIQNSLDARKSNDEPVKISFQLRTVPAKRFKGFAGIRPHLVKSREMALEQDLQHVIDYYDTAIKAIDERTNVPVLCIHDYSTHGLRGNISGASGAWAALVKGTGITQKNAAGSLGSFGHGSKAPFSYSKIRSLFYYTKIETAKGSFEERFQGKSILQTHQSPDGKGLTQAIGFYGHIKELTPLQDEAVPNWAREFRTDVTDDTGTSIYIPYTFYDVDLYPETKITVIANFFYAIQSGALEVTVDEETLSAENVVEQYWDCVTMLEHEQDDIDVGHIQDCFKSIRTIIEADFHGVQRLAKFGDIKWYIRIGDDLDKRVGISRSSGMLITRKAPMLEVFRNVKTFEMFVCVADQEGSELLKRLENPTHDNFEFDRITDPSERTQITRKYKQFQQTVRDVLNRHAAFEADQEESVSGLSNLFGEVSEAGVGSSAHLERGLKLLIKDGATIRSSASKRNKNNLGGGDGSTMGAGMQGGAGTKKSKGGNNADPNGTKVITGSGTNSALATGPSHKARNLRVNHSRSDSNEATLYFDSPVTGKCHVNVSMVGEHGEIPVNFTSNNASVKAIEVDLTRGQRCKLVVEFKDKVKNHTLEANIVEIGDTQ